MFKIWIWNRRYKFENQPRLEPRASDISKFELFHLNWIVKYVQIYVFKYFYHEQFVNCLPCLMKCRCNAGLLHGTYCLLFMITKNLFLIQYWERRERKLRRLNDQQVTQQASLVQNWSLKLYINLFFGREKIQIF